MTRLGLPAGGLTAAGSVVQFGAEVEVSAREIRIELPWSLRVRATRLIE